LVIYSKISLIISGEMVVGIIPDAVISLQSYASGTRDRAWYKCLAGGRVE
jgi:hypothetical protein